MNKIILKGYFYIKKKIKVGKRESQVWGSRV
jgi:hypothetical protein